MRRYIVAFVVLLMFGSTTALALSLVGPRTYYTDTTWATATGAEWVACNGTTTWQWGVPSNYRQFEGLHCPTVNDVTICEQWNGTSWVTIPCW